MKKTFVIRNILIGAALIASVFMFTGCPSVEGLHNQKAAEVTFVFKNMGTSISGDYSIPGNFDDWDNTTKDITLTEGQGTSVSILVKTANIQFSLVPVGEWTRPWHAAGDRISGNGSDSGIMQNFYIDGLDLSAGEITLVIDGITGTAVPELE